VSRNYYRCKDCLTAMVIDHAGSLGPTLPRCACGGVITYMGAVRRHRVVRLEDRPACDARCTSAIGPSCDCQCGAENHGTGRTVVVIAADLGPATLTAVDSDTQLRRATEYRAAMTDLDAAIRGCRLAWAFDARKVGAYVHGGAYLEVTHVHERRSRARGLRTHTGRLAAIAALATYVRKL
jgi:hypothetical protein